MRGHTYPILCGGTFFTLVLEACKSSMSGVERKIGQHHVMIESEVLKGLAKIVKKSFEMSTPTDGTPPKTITSNYKYCKNNGTRLPFTDKYDVDNFDKRVTNNYLSVLADMSSFVETFLDFIGENSLAVRLVKELLKVIERDNSIDDNTKFYIGQEGQAITKKALACETDFYLQSLLLGVWHFVVCNRSTQNTAGKLTADKWCPPNKGLPRVYNGIVGAGFERKIDVYVLGKNEVLSNDTKANSKSFDETKSAPVLPQAHECERKQATLLTVPAPYLNFVAREDELIEMEKKLSEYHYLFLNGMGGIGKTELARQYAKLHNEQYDAVQLVRFDKDIRTTVALGLLFHGIYEEEYKERFGAPNFINKLFEDKLSALRDNSVRSLIIIDNATDVDISKILAPTGEYDIICTTRKKCSRESVLEVKALNDKQFLALFREYYERPISSDDEPIINEIIDLVLGHTMTVMIIATVMREGHKTAQDMLSRLQKGLTLKLRTKIAINKEDISDEEREKAMHIHLENLFDMTDIKEDEKLSYIMTNMSIVPYSGLKMEMFYDWVLAERYEEDDNDEYDNDEYDDDEYDDDDKNYNDLNKLINLRWIQYDEKEKEISLHPVISEVASNQFKPDSEKCCDLLQSMLICADECTRQTYVERNDCAKILRFACKRIKDETIDTAWLHKSCGQILTQLADFSNARSHLKKAKDIIENIDENFVDAAEIYEAIAAVHYEFDDDEALDWYEKAFVVYLKRQEDELLDILTNVLNQLKLEEIQNRMRKLVHCTSEVISELSAHFEFDCAKEIIPDEWMESLKNELKEYEKELDLLFSMYNIIGNLHLRRDEFDEALEKFQSALKIGETLYGERHTKIADVYIGIAQCQSDNNESLNLLHKALEIYETIYVTIFGRRHPKIADACEIVAEKYHSLGEHEKASEWHQKALDIWQKFE